MGGTAPRVPTHAADEETRPIGSTYLRTQTQGVGVNLSLDLMKCNIRELHKTNMATSERCVDKWNYIYFGVTLSEVYV